MKRRAIWVVLSVALQVCFSAAWVGCCPRQEDESERDEARPILLASNMVGITIERALSGSMLSIEDAVADPNFAFAAVCEALEIRGQDWMFGSVNVLQTFKIVEILAGTAPEDIEMTLGYRVMETSSCQERAVRKGERLIWIVLKASEGYAWHAIRALPDRPENRNAVIEAVNVEQSWRPLSNGIDSEPPYLEPEEIAAKVRQATAPDTDEMLRFDAVRGLAISGYTPESAAALGRVACDPTIGETTRGYAAMGLRNFTNRLPLGMKSSIREELRDVLAGELIDTQDGIIRTLVRWGDAAYVHETLGENLSNHPMGVEVLRELPGGWVAERLWQIHEACPQSRKAVHYNKRASIGRALVKRNDERGIDILMDLLPAENAPGAQYRHNVYNFLRLSIGESFGYEAANYSPELEEAIPKMLRWWGENKAVFQLEDDGAPPRELIQELCGNPDGHMPAAVIGKLRKTFPAPPAATPSRLASRIPQTGSLAAAATESGKVSGALGAPGRARTVQVRLFAVA